MAQYNNNKVYKSTPVLVVGALITVVYLCIVWRIPEFVCRHPEYHIYGDIGPVGDFFGGTMGPAIAVLGAILTFAAFYVQYQANQQQRNEIVTQRNDWEREQLDTRFFELLKLHKENVAELEVRDEGKDVAYKGRRCFMGFYMEFQAVYRVTYFQTQALPKDIQDQVDVRYLAYAIFYFGVGDIAQKSYMKKLNDAEKRVCREVLADLWVAQYSFRYDVEWFVDRYGANFGYTPFRGHSSVLGAYYRHLFQTVRYVIDFSDKAIDEKGKYELIRTLRDQLSEFEQLMLYFNALAFCAEDWYDIFTDYRFIKNIPLEHIPDNYTSPVVFYRSEMIRLWYKEVGKDMFAGQGDISADAAKWADEFPLEYMRATF